MKRSIIAALCVVSATAHAEEMPCGTLESASGAPFALKEGERVEFRHAGKTTHGTLHVYKDVQVYRVY